MIVPTIIPSTVSYAQPTTTLPPNDPSTRTFGPQTTNNNNNITSTLNNTAASGIQNMLELSNMLEPEIQRYNLVETFNDIVYAFGFIQGNLTALQNQTIAEVTAAESTVGQLRAQISTLQDQLEAARADLAEATAAAGEEDTAPDESDEESEEASEEEEEEEEGSDEEDSSPTTTSPSQTRLEILETLVNTGGEGEDDGPRTDPEGDGGFPGDIDG